MPSFFKNMFSSFSPARQAADAEVADERFGGDEGQRHLLGQLGLAQLVGGVEQELIRRAEAARALRRADHDRARVVEKFPPCGARPFGVTQRRDRLGVAIGAQARHDIELVAEAGGDHQVVVTITAAGGGHRAGGRVDGRRLGVHELDPMRVEGRLQREGDIGRAALAERQPDQRRIEQEPVRRRNHRHLDVLTQLVLELQSRRQAAEVTPDHQHTHTSHNPHLIPMPTGRPTPTITLGRTRCPGPGP